jgi:Zn-dependent protease with chaperone function
MSAAAQIGFNLLINAVISFGLALLIVYAVLRGFRMGSGFGRRALLLLPLVKVAWDLRAGIPAESFLWAKLRGAQQELGSLAFGVAWNRLEGPRLSLRLGAISDGERYPQSAGDLLHAGLIKHVAPWLPEAVLVAVLTICALRLALRLAGWLRLALSERRWRSRGVLLETRRVGARELPVYASSAHTGAPFAAGTLAPCIVMPAATVAVLSPPQRAAAIEHEVAHLRHFDPLRLIALALVSDLLWFLPGLSGLLARMRTELELRADRVAVTRGADPAALAQALVRVAEQIAGARGPDASSAALMRGSALRARLSRLLEGEPPQPRLGCRTPLGRALVLTMVYGLVLTAIFLGNAPPI